MVKLSIIVPVYNVEKYLSECVESLRNQTLADIEIILVDDESRDNCPAMCDSYAREDSRIKVIHKKNEGLGMACNSGLEAASGEYVAFCDSDDWMDADAYQIMIETAQEYNAQMVLVGLKRVDNEGRYIRRLPHREKFEFHEGRKAVDALACDMIAAAPAHRLERTIQMSAKTVVYKRKVISDNNLEFVSERRVRSEDLHFNLSVLAHSTRVCVLPMYPYNYRENPISITGKGKIDINSFNKNKLLYNYTLNECKEFDLGDVGIVRTQRMFVGSTRVNIVRIFNSNLKSGQKKELISKIYNDPIWKEIDSSYPINLMPFVQKVFYLAMRYKLYFVLAILSKIKK